jgi:hypothetical protein
MFFCSRRQSGGLRNGIYSKVEILARGAGILFLGAGFKMFGFETGLLLLLRRASHIDRSPLLLIYLAE